MAAKASEDRVRADIRPPDFRAAVSKIRSIEAKRTKISSLNGEVADIWAKVEGHKVNKDAGKIFRKMDKLEGPERADVMRSLNGLIDASGWPKEERDLVDAADGNVLQMRVGQGADEPVAAKEPGDEGEEEDPEPPRRARRGPVFAGLERSRQHLSGAGQPAA